MSEGFSPRGNEELLSVHMGMSVRISEEDARRLREDPCYQRANENMRRYSELRRQYNGAYGVPGMLWIFGGVTELNAELAKTRPAKDMARGDAVEQALREGVLRFADGRPGYTSMPEDCNDGKD